MLQLLANFDQSLDMKTLLVQRGRKVVKSGGAKNPGGEASVHVP